MCKFSASEMESRHLSVLLLLAGVLCLRAANGCPEIISRSRWGAREPTEITAMSTPVEYVVIHHTVTRTCSNLNACARILRSIQNDHMNVRSFSDIGYSYLVGSDGKVYEGRGWNNVGAHAPGYNDRSIGISFIGNFQDQTPTTGQLNAAKSLISCAVSQGKLQRSYKLLGHRQTKQTACPGDKLYDIVKTWPNWTRNP